jgi:hypothetical protein
VGADAKNKKAIFPNGKHKPVTIAKPIFYTVFQSQFPGMTKCPHRVEIFS